MTGYQRAIWRAMKEADGDVGQEAQDSNKHVAIDALLLFCFITAEKGGVAIFQL